MLANLEWHVKKIHTLIRHKCNKCEKEYIAKHHLDEHVKSVHEEKNIECLKENCNFVCEVCVVFLSFYMIRNENNDIQM